VREPEHYDGAIDLDRNDGATVHDSATPSGATANASGTVTYSVYSDNSRADKFAGAGTVTGEWLLPNSQSVTFNHPGGLLLASRLFRRFE
jgi:hypothetical protein